VQVRISGRNNFLIKARIAADIHSMR
jgi:hypothetical protein